jgi:hypothetical protein
VTCTRADDGCRRLQNEKAAGLGKMTKDCAQPPAEFTRRQCWCRSPRSAPRHSSAFWWLPQIVAAGHPRCAVRDRRRHSQRKANWANRQTGLLARPGCFDTKVRRLMCSWGANGNLAARRTLPYCRISQSPFSPSRKLPPGKHELL